MIVLKEIEGNKVLFCEQDHKFSVKGLHVIVKAGTVGAKIESEAYAVGAEVDFWVDAGIKIESKVSIDRSCILAEMGEIGQFTVIVDSIIRAKRLVTHGPDMYHMASVRVSALSSRDELYVFNSELQHVTLDESSSAMFHDSVVKESSLRGNMAFSVADAERIIVASAAMESKDTVYSNIMRSSDSELFDVPILMNLTKAKAQDITVSERSSVVCLQMVGIFRTTLDCDITASNVAMIDVNITGNMIHVVNCAMNDSRIKSNAAVLTWSDDILEKAEIVTDYALRAGVHKKQVLINLESNL